MLNNQTIEKLQDMKLKAMAQMLSEPIPSDLALSFEERLGLMVEKEWTAKKNTKIKRLLRSATLGLDACIEGIEYSSNRAIDKQYILELASCVFIEKSLNIITTGKTGSGKTYRFVPLAAMPAEKVIPSNITESRNCFWKYRMQKLIMNTLNS